MEKMKVFVEEGSWGAPGIASGAWIFLLAWEDAALAVAFEDGTSLVIPP